jgi:hypothetical protein
MTFATKACSYGTRAGGWTVTGRRVFIAIHLLPSCRIQKRRLFVNVLQTDSKPEHGLQQDEQSSIVWSILG